MTAIPDVKRPPDPTSRPRALAALLRRWGPAAVWHALHPRARETFADGGPPAPASRVTYRACDGWSAPLFFLPPAAGGSGEPVILAHTLGLGPQAFRYGATPTLAWGLQQAGFSVYLLSHRGDADAVSPQADGGAAGRGLTFDGIVEADLPAAIEAVRDHAAMSSVHWIGHGLGGQLALGLLGRDPEALASVALLGTPVVFDGVPARVRRAVRTAALVPDVGRLPARWLARWAALFVEGEQPTRGRGARVRGPRVRGAMTHLAQDLPAGLVQQVDRWLDEGCLTDGSSQVELLHSLARVQSPLFIAASPADVVCPPRWAAPAATAWGSSDVTICVPDAPLGHLDLVLSPAATDSVHAQLIAWLDGRRRCAWVQPSMAASSSAADVGA